MNELQKMWATAYQQYIDGCKDPRNPLHSPSPLVLIAAREHADKVIESLNNLNIDVVTKSTDA
ncbi:hypothetical protein [Enterobacter ludwigii]|uniref:hypothetical protein n=1 Tax=Enterobacter ludwigii TaxID=299767 RepID=UPI002FFCA3B7